MTAKRCIPRVSPEARQYVQEVLDFGFHNTTSPGISGRLERAFAERFGVGFGILHCNGTATMHACLLAAGVGAGDEVIVPSLTMASTALVALYVGAVPIFSDVDAETFTMCPDDVRAKITPRTRAIIPVSIYGQSVEMDAILELAREHDLLVVEDNAQCVLGRYKGRLVGTLGHASSFSFQGSKHMTCGDGGIVITDDEAYATEIRRACVLGYSAISSKPGASAIPEELRCHPSFARHTSLGYNFRMPEIAAAVALGELERLDELVAMRRAVAGLYDQVVGECPWLVGQHAPEHIEHVYWSYAVRMTDDGPEWAEFRRRYAELGGDGFYGAWLPVHREPVFQELHAMVQAEPNRWPQWAACLPDYGSVRLPVTERLQPRLVQLKTNYFDLADAEREAELLARAIRSFG